MTTIASGLAPETAKIIYGAIDSEFSDGAARKYERLYDETVGGHRHLRAVDFQMGGVAERVGRRSEKERSEQAFHQAAAGLPAGAVGHFDLRIAKANLGGLGGPELDARRSCRRLRLVT